MGREVHPPRLESPDRVERARRMADLAVIPVLSLADVALFLDKLRGAGEGPRCFKIGRRLYVRREHLIEWIDKMSQAEA